MKKPNLLLFGLLLPLFILFFVDSSDYRPTRSFQIAWNLGHIVFFALTVSLFLQQSSILRKSSGLRQFWIIVGICLIFGILIESIQDMVGRQADWSDILRNILGGLIALVFFPHRKFGSNANFGIRSKAVVIVLLCTQLYPLILTLLDEQMARNRFPVISNFENQLELASWYSDGNMTLDKNIVSNGNSSARIELTTKFYSGASLSYFHGNWENYKQLSFSIYLPDQPALPLTYRIHDRQHKQTGNQYNDRFNQKILLKLGWNHVSIDLKDVIHSPRTRLMDIESITNIQFFAINLKQPRVIYLDNLRLE